MNELTRVGTCVNLSAGLHGGRARRQLGGHLVDGERGGDAGAQVAAGEPQQLRRGGHGGHPAPRGEQCLRGDQSQGLHLVASILRDQRRIHPVSVLATDFHGIAGDHEVFLSLPARLGRGGVLGVADGAHRGGRQAQALGQDAVGEQPAPGALVVLLLASTPCLVAW